MQRRPAVVVFAENQIRIGFEQRLDLFQVALPSSLMNGAAKGDAAPSQRDQQDGGAAEYSVVAEPPKGVARNGASFSHLRSLLSNTTK